MHGFGFFAGCGYFTEIASANQAAGGTFSDFRPTGWADLGSVRISFRTHKHSYAGKYTRLVKNYTIARHLFCQEQPDVKSIIERMVSVYIHFPFCEKRCAYCDFFTRAGEQKLIPAYVDSLVHEIEQVSTSAKCKFAVHTVFFGGGTPSLATPQQIQQILQSISQGFDLQPDAEISLEANPGTVNAEKLAALRECGINRLSFGVQSFQAEELSFLERIHTAQQARDAFGLARCAGFNNINLDLIFGIPGQTQPGWQNTLQQALNLEPEHLSLYALTIEEGTPLFRQVETGQVSPADEDLAADMYLLAESMLDEAGYIHYEISNWARAKDEKKLLCRHNMQTWLNQPYFGFGAGAHGCMGGYRYANQADIGGYIHVMQQSIDNPFPFSAAAETRQAIDRQTEMDETMLLGLRLLREGVSQQRFGERFGVQLLEVYEQPLTKLLQQGLLEWGEEDEILRLTARGHLLANRVFREFV